MTRDEYVRSIVKRAPEPTPAQVAVIRAAFDRADHASAVNDAA